MHIVVGSGLLVGDNTGVLSVRCIQILGLRKFAVYGDVVVVVVRTLNLSKRQSKFRRGGICRALIISLKVNFLRSSGIFVRFENNVVVLVNNSLVPLGNRVRFPVLYELCERFPYLGTIARSIF